MRVGRGAGTLIAAAPVTMALRQTDDVRDGGVVTSRLQ